MIGARIVPALGNTPRSDPRPTPRNNGAIAVRTSAIVGTRLRRVMLPASIGGVLFGVGDPSHDRYEHGQEWLDVVRAVWSRDDFDFDGTYFHLRGVRGKPKPYANELPFLMNAGYSPAGRDFALRNFDALFTAIPHGLESTQVLAEFDQLRERARAMGNTIGIYTAGSITCRATQREAEEYAHYALEEHADCGALDTMIALRGLTPATDAERTILRRKFTTGLGGFSFIGDPDRVTDDLAELSDCGIEGVAISFINYLNEFPLFRDEVLPRLERRGLRAQLTEQ
jgi:dimethylsulfone monooxygenase